jgi:hypothetical protein
MYLEKEQSEAVLEIYGPARQQMNLTTVVQE